MPWIILAVVIVILVVWFISAQRGLVRLDENVNNALSQIGVQLSSRFDALTALLDLAKGYAKHESETLINTVNARRSVINACSSAGDVEAQENVITDALGRINAIAEQYPDLKANQNYIEAMNSVNSYEKAVRQSRLVYNDCVTKLNRKIRMFPTSIAAGMLNIGQRDYLQAEPEKAQMPDMK